MLENNRSNAIVAADRNVEPALSEPNEQQVNSELQVLQGEYLFEL